MNQAELVSGRRIARIASLLWLAGWMGCAAEGGTASITSAQRTLTSPDGPMFAQYVYPELLRDCAFSTCHGAPQRFFRVVGPGRVRLDPTTKITDPATLPELVFSYERARDMLLSTAVPENSLLLRKPLDISAGGQSHLGADEFGRNVYASKGDPRYMMLVRWALSQGPMPTMNDLAFTEDAGVPAALPPLSAAGGPAPIMLTPNEPVNGSCSVLAGPGARLRR